MSNCYLSYRDNYVKLLALFYLFIKAMEKYLLISQIIISIALSLLILVQGKDEGFSASGSQSFKIVRRGPEKVIFNATILLSALFMLNALAFVLI